jgi:hypothetical protein
MSKRTLVIFEDISIRRNQMKKSFEKIFPDSIKVFFFEPELLKTNSKQSKPRPKNTYEDQIIDYLLDAKINIDDIALMVTDRDLSTYDEWGGLSEAVISNIGNILGIPVCLYAREDNKSKVNISKITNWSDYKIILDIGKELNSFAQECLVIFDGFESIRKKYSGLLKKKSQPKSPAEILAKILSKIEYQDRIALYGAGDQHVIEDIFPYRDKLDVIEKRMPRLLGYWLWDSILRYPGIFVYGDAAASYLNIHPEDFKKRSIKNLFKNALYNGPFSTIQEYWWRGELDNIIYQVDCTNGNDFATKKLGKNIRECKCSVDSTINAGYYCMLTQKPISDINSKSNISWFPTGADLARISKPQYEMLAPWIGLY